VTTVRDGEASGRLRVLVVDDHELVRHGLVSLLQREETFCVVAEAGTVGEAIDAANCCRPDLVVMDVRLPDGSGIEATREIRSEQPNVRVVILTSYPDEDAVAAAIMAGASGYLLKQIRGRDLLEALEAVGRGESLFDPALAEKALDRVRRLTEGVDPDGNTELTRQEQRILLLIAEGKTNREIAAETCLSQQSVKKHVSAILAKLKLQTRSQAAAFAVRHRLPGAE
jgi:DNA-binding NarL/FixJ family response regulator